MTAETPPPKRPRRLRRRYVVAALVVSQLVWGELCWAVWELGRQGIFATSLPYPKASADTLKPGVLLALYNGQNFERPVSLRVMAGGVLRIPLNGYSLGAGVTPWDMSGRLTGRLNVKQPDEYRFMVIVSGGVRVWVDGKPVANLWPRQQANAEASIPVYLTAGEHRFVLEFSNTSPDSILGIDWQGTTTPRRTMIADDFLPDTASPLGRP